MKKIILVLLFFTVGIVKAQNLKYGVLLGNSAYFTTREGSDGISGDEAAGFEPGVFVDYHLKNKYGIISELTFTKRELQYSYNDPIYYRRHSTFLNTIQLTVSMKRSFSNNYFEGGYLLLGTSFSHLLSATKFENILAKNKIGVLLGYGNDFNKYIGIEGKMGYDIKYLYGNKQEKKIILFTFGLALKVDLSFLLN